MGCDLGDVIHVESTRAAGGLMERATGNEPTVYLEITGHLDGVDGPETTTRFLFPLDLFMGVMALLEHAGKTALSMEPT